VEERLRHSLNELIAILEGFVGEFHLKISEASQIIAHALKRSNKILICGNGGSAADAQHMAAEFVNRFLMERAPLPAIALSTDTSVITSIGNDYGFEQIFEKQLRALGQKGDVLLAISTSGKSLNCIKAVSAAKEMGVFSIGLLGRDGGDMVDLVDLPLVVRHLSTPRIQEVHTFVIHIICQMVEEILFGRKSA
jgi:D-sedoheptulose 7-phosphate isomerase